MRQRATDAWKDILAGKRPATWADFLGHAADATYLSEVGVKLVPRMAKDLDSWFGSDWLSTAIGPSEEKRIPWLARFSPAMTTYGDQGAAGAFIELVRWWAALRSQATQRGMADVRRDLRRDITVTRLLHTLTQTRLGAIATTAGMQVIYEPTPGDLLILDQKTCVTVEVFAMTSPRDLESQMRQSDEMFDHLAALGRSHNVHFRGTLPPLATDLTAWRYRVGRDADAAGRLGIALCVIWDGCELIVEPGHAPVGASLEGPAIEGDTGGRLRKRVQAKARQISRAPSGWLWLENHGAIDMLVPIQSKPLVQQLQAYEALFDGALDDVRSVSGVTFSSAGARTWPPPSREHSSHGLAHGLRQPLPLDRVRTSFHLPTVDGAENRLMWRLIEGESDWLDRALSALGVCQAMELVRADLRPAIQSPA